MDLEVGMEFETAEGQAIKIKKIFPNLIYLECKPYDDIDADYYDLVMTPERMWDDLDNGRLFCL